MTTVEMAESIYVRAMAAMTLQILMSPTEAPSDDGLSELGQSISGAAFNMAEAFRKERERRGGI